MALYFIAILTPETIDRQVREWKDYMRLNYGCKAAQKSPAHITLIPPFTLNEELKNSLTSLLADFARTQQGFPLVLHNFSAFPPRVIYVDVLPSPQLNILQKQLEKRLIAHDYPVKLTKRQFHPHVTIANRDLREEDFKVAFSTFSSLPFHESFNAENISLLEHEGASWKTVFSTALLA